MSEPILRVLSLGAGVQSTTMALMAALGEIEVDESYFGGTRKGKPGRGTAGKVAACAVSSCLQCRIGLVLMNSSDHGVGTVVEVGCRDGSMQAGELVDVPFYDKAG